MLDLLPSIFSLELLRQMKGGETSDEDLYTETRRQEVDDESSDEGRKKGG